MSSDFASRLAQALEAVTVQKIRRDLLLQQRETCSNDLEAAKETSILLEKVRELLNTLVVDRKRVTLDKIERLVTYGLRTIFEDDSYTFKVKMDSSRKQIVYSFELAGNGYESSDLENARGGGIVNVVSFLLTVVVQLLLDSEARTFVLDERFSYVSKVYVPNIASLLKEFSSRMGLQFLHVTHQEQLAEEADVVFEVTKSNDGVATIEKVNQ